MPKTRSTLVVSTLLIALTGAAAATAVRANRLEAERAALDSAHAQALAQFRAGRHADTYGRLMPLADAGHVPSAQLALLMLRNGKAMFGSEWSATEPQQLRWNAHAVNGARKFVPIVGNDAGD